MYYSDVSVWLRARLAPCGDYKGARPMCIIHSSLIVTHGLLGPYTLLLRFERPAAPKNLEDPHGDLPPRDITLVLGSILTFLKVKCDLCL